MGAKLGKSKSVPISEKVNGHGKEVITTPNNHINGTTTLERKIKRKKEKISNKKSSDIKVDKHTSTDGNIISSSSTCIKQLVDGSVYNNQSSDAHGNSINRSDLPSKDVQELRDACIRRGIISSETNKVTLPIPSEQDHQENSANTVEKSIDEIITPVVTNNEEVQNEEQQQEQIES